MACLSIRIEPALVGSLAFERALAVLAGAYRLLDGAASSASFCRRAMTVPVLVRRGRSFWRSKSNEGERRAGSRTDWKYDQTKCRPQS